LKVLARRVRAMNRVESQMINRNRQIDKLKLPSNLYNIMKIGLAGLVVAGVLAIVVFAYIWFSGGSAEPGHAITVPDLKVSATGKLFRIDPTGSEARFITHETLLGQAKTVVGSTREVAGQIMVDFARPSITQLRPIRINARTVATDNEVRNRALRGQILRSNQDEFEFISFVPTKLIGLPEQISVGQTLTFQVEGKLTVRNETRDVVFEATVKIVS